MAATVSDTRRCFLILVDLSFVCSMGSQSIELMGGRGEGAESIP